MVKQVLKNIYPCKRISKGVKALSPQCDTQVHVMSLTCMSFSQEEYGNWSGLLIESHQRGMQAVKIMYQESSPIARVICGVLSLQSLHQVHTIRKNGL